MSEEYKPDAAEIIRMLQLGVEVNSRTVIDPEEITTLLTEITRLRNVEGELNAAKQTIAFLMSQLHPQEDNEGSDNP